MFQKVADQFGCSRSALSRRWRGVSRSKATYDEEQRAIPLQQELELVQYIIELHKTGLSPTRQMVRNFGSEVAGRELHISWVDRFLHRHHDHLMLRFGPKIDRVRHHADSLDKYDSYFDLLHQKMEQYRISRRLTFNMDEKGFMLGKEILSKRVFSKLIWEKDGVRGTVQDGSREWMTILPTICADGTTLPTSIIYLSDGYNILDTWVDDIPPDDTLINVSSTPTGWTNNTLGMAWLRRFNDATRRKARRLWRLLICDGHCSHLTMEFLTYATKNRILVMVFPSHSTHTLQPLDVGVFGPLQRAYSSELSRVQQQSQGLLEVKKSDFYRLFKAAYDSSFTEKNILSAFEATGIWPMDRTPVTTKFDYTTPPLQTGNTGPSDSLSHLSPANWKRTRRLLIEVVKDNNDILVRKLEGAIHRASTQNKLLQLENKRLLVLLNTKNKYIKYSRRLPLEGKKKRPTDAAFYSPKKLKEAKAIQAQKDRDEEVVELQKRARRGERAANGLKKKEGVEERRVERARVKEAKEKERAEKAAEQERQKQQNNTSKAAQTSQKGKRKASKPLSKQQKRQKRSGGGAVGGGTSGELASAALPEPAKTTSRGRTITLPSKFK